MVPWPILITVAGAEGNASLDTSAAVTDGTASVTFPRTSFTLVVAAAIVAGADVAAAVDFGVMAERILVAEQ